MYNVASPKAVKHANMNTILIFDEEESAKKKKWRWKDNGGEK